MRYIYLILFILSCFVGSACFTVNHYSSLAKWERMSLASFFATRSSNIIPTAECRRYIYTQHVHMHVRARAFSAATSSGDDTVHNTCLPTLLLGACALGNKATRAAAALGTTLESFHGPCSPLLLSRFILTIMQCSIYMLSIACVATLLSTVFTLLLTVSHISIHI